MNQLERLINKGETGRVTCGGESARATIIHDSPADQEAIEVVLLGDLRCLEPGNLIEVQRHEFDPDVAF